MIAGVVVAKNPEEALKIMKGGDADLYEIRIDAMENLEELEILKPFADSLIFTVRSGEEGGIRNMSPQARLALYEKVLRLHPAYVDVELNSAIASNVMELAREFGAKVILSLHEFHSTPSSEKLRDFVELAKSKGADIAKIVCMANSIHDNLRVLELYGEYGSIISFCMGPLGKISRVMSALFAPFTYASLTLKTAPGQLSLQEMRDLLRRLGYER